ncbi:galactokinase [Rubrivirga sp.]|uniref:galactokinase n=1 Tax=Rubrivirga sp. TaxID=1885344 RepID=UPI003B5168DC
MPDADLDRQRAAARAAHADAFGPGPTWAAYAPGRVNLIGDHTDYTGGWVLPMTIHRGTHAVARARTDGTVRAVAEGYGTAAPLRLGEPVGDRPLWQRYVLGVAREVAARADGPPGGADVLTTGDMPIGAGLSSSASLAVAVGLALAAAWDVEIGETEMALLAQHVEHVDAGVNCGIMDQVAVRSGRAGHAVLLDCRSLAHRAVPVPTDRAAVVIVDSGVGRSLAGSAYNERRASVERAAEVLAERGVAGPDGAPVASLRDVTAADLDAHADALGDLLPRARHVVTENARAVAAADALAAGDVAEVGRRMAGSHASLRDDYDVSGPELDRLVALAHAAGSFGSRLTGAGFGGCTVNLVRPDRVEAWTAAVREGYRRETGRDADVFVVRQNREAGVAAPGDPA